MENKVLVAYASKHGATMEIAEKIGQVLRQSGLQADVLAANRIRDITSYSAVVLGSGVYIGRWRKEAATFLKAKEQVLAEKPLWLFSSGPTGEGMPAELTKGWLFPKALQSVIDRIRPRDIAIFHGAINAKSLNPIEKWMVKNVKAPLGDFRDWEAVISWATAIAGALKK